MRWRRASRRSSRPSPTSGTPSTPAPPRRSARRWHGSRRRARPCGEVPRPSGVAARRLGRRTGRQVRLASRCASGRARRRGHGDPRVPRGGRLPPDDHGGPGPGRRGHAQGAGSLSDRRRRPPRAARGRRCHRLRQLRHLGAPAAGCPRGSALLDDADGRRVPAKPSHGACRRAAVPDGCGGGRPVRREQAAPGGEGDPAAPRDHSRFARRVGPGQIGGAAGRALRRRSGVGQRAGAVTRPLRANAATVRGAAPDRRAVGHADAGRSPRHDRLGARRHLVGGIPARRRDADR